MSNSKNMKKSAVVLFILMIISKFLGIIRESVMFSYYGAGTIADVYVTSSGIPNILFGIIAGGLISTFIPIYSRVHQREGEERASQFMNNTLTVIFFITLVFLVIGLFFTEELVLLNAQGYEGEKLAMTVDFTRITLFALLTNGVFSIFSGYHQHEGRFYVAPVTGFFLNFVVISSIIVSSAYAKPIIMAYGLVLGSLFQLLFASIIALTKGKHKYKFTFNLKDEYIKPMIAMALPIIFGSSITQINTLIDRTIASTLFDGSVAVINNASKISDAVFSLFVSSLTTVMYPTIIKQANKKEYTELKSTITEIMNIISIIVIPATIGVLILAEPVVNLFFRKEGADAAIALYNIKIALMGAIIGLFAISIKDVLVRTFYSLNDSKTPVYSSIVSIILNVILNLVLKPYLGVAGLTLATSISTYIGTLILYLALNKRLQGLQTKRLLKTVGKIFAASMFMGVAVFFVHRYLNTLEMRGIVNLFASIGIGGIVYLSGLWIMKVPEFFDIIDLAKEKLRIGSKK